MVAGWTGAWAAHAGARGGGLRAGGGAGLYEAAGSGVQAAGCGTAGWDTALVVTEERARGTAEGLVVELCPVAVHVQLPAAAAAAARAVAQDNDHWRRQQLVAGVQSPETEHPTRPLAVRHGGPQEPLRAGWHQCGLREGWGRGCCAAGRAWLTRAGGGCCLCTAWRAVGRAGCRGISPGTCWRRVLPVQPARARADGLHRRCAGRLRRDLCCSSADEGVRAEWAGPGRG